jgi:hypothetical protein
MQTHPRVSISTLRSKLNPLIRLLEMIELLLRLKWLRHTDRFSRQIWVNRWKGR